MLYKLACNCRVCIDNDLPLIEYAPMNICCKCGAVKKTDTGQYCMKCIVKIKINRKAVRSPRGYFVKHNSYEIFSKL